MPGKPQYQRQVSVLVKCNNVPKSISLCRTAPLCLHTGLLMYDHWSVSGRSSIYREQTLLSIIVIIVFGSLACVLWIYGVVYCVQAGKPRGYRTPLPIHRIHFNPRRYCTSMPIPRIHLNPRSYCTSMPIPRIHLNPRSYCTPMPIPRIHLNPRSYCTSMSIPRIHLNP